MSQIKVGSTRKKHDATRPKVIKLHHHHAKPYRKRHYGLLIVAFVGLAFIAGLAIEYRTQIISGAMSSRNFVAGLFGQEDSYALRVHSMYGFNITFDQRSMYASAINGEGDLVIGDELSENDAYSVVRLAPTQVPETSTQSSLTLSYHPEVFYESKASSEEMQALVLQDAGLDVDNVTRTSIENRTLAGQDFEVSYWQTKPDDTLAGGLVSKTVLYTATVRNHPFTIVLNQGVSGETMMLYDAVLQTLSFDEVFGAIEAPTSDIIAKTASQRTLLDTVLFSDVASAAQSSTVSTSEKAAATYGPAVVKIYNVYCADALVDESLYGTDACSAGSGSGFFVSPDGYIGTNGHVATMDPKDLVIGDAVKQLSIGKSQYLNYLLSLTKLTQAEVNAKETNAAKLALMVDRVYELDSSRFALENVVQNLLVGLSEEQPDVKTLVENTKDRIVYTPPSTLKSAKVVAADYRAVDGIDGFRASDVALIKIDGSNYPVVKLGSVDLVNQGADLAILGFPGSAGSNGISESSTSRVTLTSGKVSAIKNAQGSDKKLIETDTTIGHGNSGGPVLNNDGFAVGIATYTIDGSGSGDGVFNYIRNMKDLTDLAEKSGVSLNTKSLTQVAWEKGLDAFYTAHYSKSLKHFAVVQELDANHSRVEEFINAAKTRIANGEDVQDFPVIPVVIIAALLIAGGTVAVVLIVRHKHAHNAYKAGMSQGAVLPAAPGDQPQHVMVSAPLVTPTAPGLAEAPAGLIVTSTREATPVTPPVEPQPSAPASDGTPASYFHDK